MINTHHDSVRPLTHLAVLVALLGMLSDEPRAQQAAGSGRPAATSTPARTASRAPQGADTMSAAAVPHLIRRYPAISAEWINDSTLSLQGHEASAEHDLNGDGDQDDSVPVLADVASGALQIIPRAALARVPVGDAPPRHVVLFTSELQQGQDLDGNGLLIDVAEVFDTRTASIHTVGPAESGVVASTESLYTHAMEDFVGQDVNGNGSLTDYVDIAHSFHTGHTRFLGVNHGFLGFAEGQILLRENSATTGVGFVHAYDPTDDSVVTLPISAYTSQPQGTSNIRWFLEAEPAVGQDMNGDGDAKDQVIVRYEAATKTVTNTGLDTEWAQEQDGALQFLTLESTLGVDQNADGDLLDGVFATLDLDTGAVTPWDLVVDVVHQANGSWSTYISSVGPMQVAGPWVYVGVIRSFPTSPDRELVAIDSRTGVSVSVATGFEWPGFVNPTFVQVPTWVGEHWAAWLQAETTVDLNGDGDVDPMDRVLHVREHATGVVEVIPLACRQSETWITDGLLVSLIDEAQQGVDLTGDGDLSDGVPVGIDLDTGKRIVAGVDGKWVIPQPGGELMSFRETTPTGSALTVLDLRTGVHLTVPGVNPIYPYERIRGRSVAVPRDEFAPGVGDLNGDGDTDDLFVEVWTF